MKRYFLFFTVITFLSLCYCLEIISYGVDGSSGNVNVSIKSRKPIFHWKYEGTVEYFELKLSTGETKEKGVNNLLNGTTIWYIKNSTSTENTFNRITRIEYNGNFILEKNNTYYWSLTLYSESSSIGVTDWFYVTSSDIELTRDKKVDLKVDYNNPFCPYSGEITKFKYKVLSTDLHVKIHIFSISGKYITTLTDHPALKDVVYTIDWDGKDKDGNILPQGIYIVTLVPEGEESVSQFVGIIDRR